MSIRYGLAFVIEADHKFAGLCESALHAVGFEVETFVDGRPAYDRLAVDPAPRLALVDLELPNVSGHEITWEMWFSLGDTKIIIIAPDQETAAMYQDKAGVDRVLIKPFSQDELTKIVRPYANPSYKG